jgi:hypothetical protein
MSREAWIDYWRWRHDLAFERLKLPQFRGVVALPRLPTS